MAHEDDEHGKSSGGGHGGGSHAAHGGGGHEEHEGAPEWLISFADNVALMMGFFVIMLAMYMKPVVQASAAAADGEGGEKSAAVHQVTDDMLDFAIGVREAFNNPIDKNDPRDALLARRIREREAEAEARTPGQKGTQRDVKSIRPTEYYGMGGSLTFDAGSSEFSTAARAELADLLKHRRGSRNIVEVRGHCSAAEAFDRPDRGMSLATERAMTVARALVEAGVGWNQIRIIACADNDRVAQRTYDQIGHRANQRVEVIETPTSVDDESPAPVKAPDAGPKNDH